jgi:hypothetical protein
MVFALAEREEAQHLLSCLPTLILRVPALNPKLPVELDALKCREVVSLSILRLQLERFRRLLKIKLSRRRVHTERANEIENHIAAENFTGFSALSENNRSFSGFLARNRCD